jgi:hypothetical protein
LLYFGGVTAEELWGFWVRSWVQGCPRHRHLRICWFLRKLYFTDFFVQLHYLLVARLNAWF